MDRTNSLGPERYFVELFRWTEVGQRTWVAEVGGPGLPRWEDLGS